MEKELTSSSFWLILKLMDKSLEPMSESGQQFAEIFEEYYDPVKIAERKMKEQREKRAEQMRLDTGL